MLKIKGYGEYIAFHSLMISTCSFLLTFCVSQYSESSFSFLFFYLDNCFTFTQLICYFLDKNGNFLFQVDCGAGITIKKSQIAEIELICASFSSRVNSLRKAFWKDKIMVLSDRSGVAGGELIPHVNLERMRGKLVYSLFSWNENSMQNG